MKLCQEEYGRSLGRGGSGGLVAKSHLSFVTQWTLSTGFPRQEYWCELPFPSPGDLPNLGIEPRSPALPADALPSESPGKPSLLERLTELRQTFYWLGYQFIRIQSYSQEQPSEEMLRARPGARAPSFPALWVFHSSQVHQPRSSPDLPFWVFMEAYGPRILEGHSPQGHKELDTT